MTPLPAAFLDALDAEQEVLVTSRDGDVRGSVPTWFLVDRSSGSVLLFTLAFSVKARRWQHDPWVRLRVPGTGQSAEGEAHFVHPDELDPELADRVVERWAMQGATTVPGLLRGLRDGQYVLVRVAGRPDRMG